MKPLKLGAQEQVGNPGSVLGKRSVSYFQIPIKKTRAPWAVDRIGRLVAGSFILLCTVMIVVNSYWWIGGVIACAVNLVLTSLGAPCPLRMLLLRFGAREREDLFFPGGQLRPQVRDSEGRLE